MAGCIYCCIVDVARVSHVVQNSFTELESCNGCLRVFLYLVELPVHLGKILCLLNLVL